MSNRFNYLDFLFPCGPERDFGEVVGISVVASRSFVFNTHKAFAKRKQWYRDASVNAWHLHRALCREIKSFDAYAGLPVREVTRALGDIVDVCYLSNYVYDNQYSDWELCAIDWHPSSRLERFSTLLIGFDGVSRGENDQLVDCRLLRSRLHELAVDKKLRLVGSLKK